MSLEFHQGQLSTMKMNSNLSKIVQHPCHANEFLISDSSQYLYHLNSQGKLLKSFKCPKETVDSFSCMTFSVIIFSVFKFLIQLV